MPLFRGTKRWLILVTGMLLSSILLAACGENSPSILSPAGPVASSESGVFYAILIIATIVFVAVEGVLIFSIIRFRERPGAPTPKQLHGNTKIEMIWTIVPEVNHGDGVRSPVVVGVLLSRIQYYHCRLPRGAGQYGGQCQPLLEQCHP